MDFGALICKPRLPLCNQCVLNDGCSALRTGKPENFPVKSKKAAKKIRYFNYLVPRIGNYYYIRKRCYNDIWKDLYEFPYAEAERAFDKNDAEEFIRKMNTFGTFKFAINSSEFKFRQVLSHQIIYSTFHFIELNEDISMFNDDIMRVELRELNKFAYSKTIDWFLSQNSIYL